MNPTPALPRIGLGIDLHRLETGRPCTIGGIVIPFEKGPVGHSDGDVVLHAACDAVLGAAGADDLGTLFSDRDPANKDRDSAEFCREALRQVRTLGLAVASLDVVVEAERPKIAPHRAAMRRNLAALFDLDVGRVNVRGKTGEGIGEIGRSEAIRATAVALLVDI